jgi:hypothetical protein
VLPGILSDAPEREGKNNRVRDQWHNPERTFAYERESREESPNSEIRETTREGDVSLLQRLFTPVRIHPTKPGGRGTPFHDKVKI